MNNVVKDDSEYYIRVELNSVDTDDDYKRVITIENEDYDFKKELDRFIKVSLDFLDE